MNITNARLKDGLLEIDLEKVIPEEEKEKIIAISKE
jgi:HSP20 family molecular chaperone IbpA